MLGKFINHCEDSLTGAVFTHLLHLPSEIVWRILRNACCTDSLPEHAGEPLSVDFWPSWSADGTDNANRVVPDLFMRFAGFDLIVEAKRWDHCMQDKDQWEKEVVAYVNEHGNEELPVKMIALGGIWQTEDAEVSVARPASESGEPVGNQSLEIKCPVHMCRWSRLLTECQRMERELGGMNYQSSQTRAHQRILSDLINLFAWHGFQTGTWFADIVSKLPQLGASMQSYQQAFKNVSSQIVKQ